jgi:hypothetical protein
MSIARIKEYLHTLLYQKAYSRAVFTTLGLAAKEIRMSFRQFFTWRSPVFSFFRAIKYMLLPLLRLLQGRSVKWDYGFTGEDRLIESLLKTRITYNGFYVDVGCNDPRFLSNSFLFYRRGWRGICVDANEKLINKHRTIRPNDTAICALVSDTTQERTFYELTNSVLSTTETQFLSEYVAQGQQINKARRLQPQTLTQILDTCQAPAVFDYLSVDAEEHDLQVLQSLDFNRYTPRLIVVEDETFDPANPAANEILRFLSEKQYRLAGSILKNVYYLKS